MILAVQLMLPLGAVVVALFFIFSGNLGTEELDTTYQSEPEGISSGWSYTPDSPPSMTTMTAKPTVTITTPSSTLNTPSTTKVTKPSTTASTTFPMTPTTKTTAPLWRPMNPKPILCTFGLAAGRRTVGPRDGVCDIIIFDYFYARGKGTFLNHTASPLRWFGSYIQNNTGATEFGLGIHHSQARVATDNLGTTEGQVTVRRFWHLKIRHYGLLKFPVHAALVTARTIATEYINLFKRLRGLQEVNRGGKFDEPGYLILGIGLYAPRNGTAYDYLKEILQNAPIDAVVIRTHLEGKPQVKTSCKITGPNVYANPFNKYEVSMVEALDYVQNNSDQFRGHSLMVSFSMSLFSTKPRVNTSVDDFQMGRDCEFIQIRDIAQMCVDSKINNSDRIVPTQHVMHGFNMTADRATTYDSPDTIMWKLCMSTKQYPTLQFGVALFSLEHEDGTRRCSRIGSGRFTHMAGYWRAEEVSKYVKDEIRNPDFSTLHPTC